jgi:type IV pilus assembly protein PilM
LDQKSIGDKIKDYFEEKFYVGPKGIIGIDFGMSAIKMAEVQHTSEGYKVNKYVSIDLPEGSIIEDEIHKEDEVIHCLQQGLKELNTSNKWACISLSGPNTILKRLQLPGGTYEEIEDSIYWEIEQYLPFPVDEANISFSIVGENQGGGVDVLIGAAKKSLVSTFKELVERVGLKVKIVDLGVTAVMNVFEIAASESLSNMAATWILMDLGAQKSELMIYKKNILVFNKEISIGGLTITEEIQRQMGVNFLEAESLKIHGDGSGNVPEEILNIINQVLDSFFADLKKSLDFWTSTSSEEVFDGCFLTGGTSQVPGIVEALQEVLGTEVQVMNPFSKFTYNQKNISEEMITDIVYRGVCAIGLAMREVKK